MKKIEIKNIDSIIHLDGMNISKLDNRNGEVKKAMEEVLENKDVYNALKRLADK